MSRRGLLAGAGAATVTVLGAGAAAAAVPETTGFGPVTVRPGDFRYDNLLRGNNFRYVGRPEEIRVVGSTDQVVRAVSDAVRSGRRIAARSGGHCFENFTADPAVRMLLDLSPMDEVGYDADRRAFAGQPGATLGHVYRTLFKGWGVTIPGGGCPEVGAGGHFAGGGYGPLSRRYGSVVDHLYGVEVVVVDHDGTARAVVATREPDDPHRDLWWAHTGLLRNFGTWHERNSAPGSPYAGLYGILQPSHRAGGTVMLVAQVDADLPNADSMVTDFLAAVTAGTDLTPALDIRRTMPWLHRMTWPGTGEPGDVLNRRYKIKAAYLRRGFTDTQLAAVCRNLTNSTGGPDAGMLLVGYGGQARAVAPGATAIAQRDAVMKAGYAPPPRGRSANASSKCSNWSRRGPRTGKRRRGCSSPRPRSDLTC